MEILFEQLHNLQKLQPLQLSPGYNNLATKSIEFIIYKVLLKVNKISILIEKWAKNIKQKFIEFCKETNLKHLIYNDLEAFLKYLFLETHNNS